MRIKKITRMLILCTTLGSGLFAGLTSHASKKVSNCERSLAVESSMHPDSVARSSVQSSMEGRQDLKNDSHLSLQEKMSKYQPYGPRGFVIGSDAKTPAEIAESVDAGLGAGYFQWVQSTYVVNRQLVLDRMAKDKADGIQRNEKFFGELEVRRKILAQITENSGRLNVSTAPFVLIADWKQSDLEGMFKSQEKMGHSQEITRSFLETIESSPLYAAKFIDDKNFQIELVPDEVKSRFIELELFINSPETEDGKAGYFFMQTSWNDGMHGAIQFKDWADAGFIKNMRRLRRKIMKEGFSINFNQTDISEFNYIMDRCASMPRKDGPNFKSRFTEEELESWRILFNRGRAFSVGIINPDGQVVAGTFGYVNRENGIIQGESVFYPISLRVDVLKEASWELVSEELVWDSKTMKYVSGEYESVKSFFERASAKGEETDIVFGGGQIDLARVAIGTLGERALLAGAKFMDAGMVTEFTASMKGVPLKNEDWKALVAEARVHGVHGLDFESPYDLSEEDKVIPLIEENFLRIGFPSFLSQANALISRASEAYENLNTEESKSLILILRQLEGTLARVKSGEEAPSMTVYRQASPLVDKLVFMLDGDVEAKSRNILK